MYDLIGDIHGHAGELLALLDRLGYERTGGVYRHPQRQVIFLGDFIDRGPRIRETLEIVRAMTDSGAARAVMGNHELNALAYHTADVNRPGEYLRPRTENNTHQHEQTLRQLSPGEMKSALAWFRTLPLWLELPGLRAIHACWDARCLNTVAAGLHEYGGVTNAFLHAACRRGESLFDATEILLKGKEAALPAGFIYEDRYGHKRTASRVRWFRSPHNATYRDYVLNANECPSDELLAADILAAADPYPPDAPPVFVGHYWLEAAPTLWADNVACLDYSVAKGGKLVAYCWDGEQRLQATKFVWVKAGETPI